MNKPLRARAATLLAAVSALAIVADTTVAAAQSGQYPSPNGYPPPQGQYAPPPDQSGYLRRLRVNTGRLPDNIRKGPLRGIKADPRPATPRRPESMRRRLPVMRRPARGMTRGPSNTTRITPDGIPTGRRNTASKSAKTTPPPGR